ncbi:MAG TPA: cyclic nucleotide-binding domain-containing protein, partial [Nannocystis sp.]
PAASLAILHGGSLACTVNGTVLDHIRAPAMIGETALFVTGAHQTATLTADEATVVISMSSAGLRRLRAEANPLYAAILEHALVSTLRRVQQLDRQIAQFRQGNFAAPSAPATEPLIARLWSRLRPPPQPDRATCPPLDPLLARQPILAAQPEARGALASAFTAQYFRRGDSVARQGTVDPRAFVLAAGRLDALRTVEERGAAILLARFEPGAVFGVQALIEGGPRGASIVATTDGWLYHIDHAAHARLAPEVRTAWMETMLSVLSSQCATACLTLQGALVAFATNHPEALPSMVVHPRSDAGELDAADSFVVLRNSPPPSRRRR